MEAWVEVGGVCINVKVCFWVCGGSVGGRLGVVEAWV